MSIEILNHYRSLNDIPSREIEACRNGRFYHWRRVYIVQSDNGITVLSLTILNRLVKTLQELVGGDYFARVLKSKNVVLLIFVDAPKSPQSTQSGLSSVAATPSSLPYYFPIPPQKTPQATTTPLPGNTTPMPNPQPLPPNPPGKTSAPLPDNSTPKPNPQPLPPNPPGKTSAPLPDNSTPKPNPQPLPPNPPVSTPPPAPTIDRAAAKIAFQCIVNEATLSDADMIKMAENIKKLIEEASKRLFSDRDKLTIGDSDFDLYRDTSLPYDQRKIVLPGLMNYLVLTRQIVAYYTDSNTLIPKHTLFLTPEALQKSNVDQPTHADHKTLKTEAILMAKERELNAIAILPAPSHFGPIEKSLLDTAQKELKQYHRSRILAGEAKCLKLSLVYDNEKPTNPRDPLPAVQVMDFLLEQQAISAWNYSKHTAHKEIYAMVDQKDSLPNCSLEWKPWRSLNQIKRENQIRDNFLSTNRIVVPPGLTPPLTEAEENLIKYLNKRSEHGPFAWNPSEGADVASAERLKQLGLIHAYWDIATDLGKFKVRYMNIYVKKADVPAGDRMYVK